MMIASLTSLGLGEAYTILVGRGETTFRRAVRTFLTPVLVASFAGGILVVVVANAQLADRGRELGQSVLVAALAVPLTCLWNVTGALANVKELIVSTSIIRVMVHAASFVGVVLLVIVFELHITGAILAFGIASAAGFVATTRVLAGQGTRLGLAIDLSLLKRALKLGLVVQVAHSMLVMAARVDVLFVYGLVGRAEAGIYSVALTVGQLVSSASLAVSFAVFPRVARVSEEETYPLIAKASRIGLAVSLLSLVVLSCLIPFILPLAFGDAYRPSVGPALLLLLGGVFFAQQHLLATARTARGRTKLQLIAYGTTLFVIVGLDLLLIPQWGMYGAAAAAVMGPASGLAVCAASYAKDASGREVSIMSFFPRREDFLFLFRFVSQPFRRSGGAESR